MNKYVIVHVPSQKVVGSCKTYAAANSLACKWATDLGYWVYDEEEERRSFASSSNHPVAENRQDYINRLRRETVIATNYEEGTVQPLDANRAHFGEVEGYDENHV